MSTQTSPLSFVSKIEFLKATLQNLQERLSTVLALPTENNAPNSPLRPLPITIPWYNSGQRELFRQQGEIDYPYANLTISDGNRDTQSFNSAARRRGIAVPGAPGSNLRYLYHVVPIMMSLNLEFKTNTADDILAFIHAWHLGEIKSQFELTNNSVRFRIRVVYGTDVNIAELNVDNSDGPTTISATTTLQVTTWVGEVETIARTRSINLQSAISSSLAAVPFDPATAPYADHNIVVEETNFAVNGSDGVAKPTP